MRKEQLKYGLVWMVISSVLLGVNGSSATENNPSLIISEFMADNSKTLADGDGEYSDWIEIYNPTNETICINSWYLTDDLSQPAKWRFPSTDILSLTIAPGKYFIVFASGKETSDTPYIDKKSNVHTNFKLTSEEDLALVRADGQTVVHFYQAFPRQKQDISYGTSEMEKGTGYFTSPTPGESNSQMFVGFVEDTRFSVDRGFYNEPFDLIIATDTKNATIRYTLDGTEPSETNGEIYTAPLRIEKTTTLRAAAFLSGYVSSNIDTQTYIFISDVIVQSPNGESPGGTWPSPSKSSSQGGNPGRNPGGNPGMGGSQAIDYGMDPDVVNSAQYKDLIDDALLAIPSLSIVTDLKNLFDTKTGIYMNAQQDGIAWERPISLELIDPDGDPGFQVNAGLRIRGGVSRAGSNPKHNFRILFRSEYGDAKLKFALFGDEGVEEFDKVDLRTAQNFSWQYSSSSEATWLYDVFTRDTEGALGKPYTRSRFYHLYINGQYWGLYQTEERPEASFASSYLGGDKEDYDTIKADNDNGVIYAVDGNLTAYQTLWTEITAGVTQNEDYFRLQGLEADGLTRNPDYPKYLDVDTLIDYMLVIYYSGDRDCPLGPPGSDSRSRNLYAVFNRKNPNGFQFITHDNEWSLLAGQSSGMGQSGSASGVNINRINASLGSSLRQKTNFNPWWMHNQIMTDNDEYRLRFADRVYKHFFNNGALAAVSCATRFLSREDEIDLAIIAESARWGDYQSANRPKTRDADWLPAVNKNLNNFILASPSTRTDIVFKQIKAKGWYPAINPPVFNQHGGEIAAGFQLSATSDTENGEIYYTLDGSDPRLPGGAVSPNAQVYTGAVSLTRSTRVLARVLKNQTWSALAEATFLMKGSVQEFLRITELHYHPAAPTETETAAGYDNADDFEFIELYNTSADRTLDLTNVAFTNGIDYRFELDDIPQLAPQSVMLLVSNRAAFELRYGSGLPVFGEYTGNLRNGGERIQLTNANGNTILDFEYSDVDPWPQEPDGNGPSLQVINVFGDYNDPANWKASEEMNGTPATKEEQTTPVSFWALY